MVLTGFYNSSLALTMNDAKHVGLDHMTENLCNLVGS